MMRWLRDLASKWAEHLAEIQDPCMKDPKNFGAMLKRIYWAIRKEHEQQEEEQIPKNILGRAVHLEERPGEACREAGSEELPPVTRHEATALKLALEVKRKFTSHPSLIAKTEPMYKPKFKQMAKPMPKAEPIASCTPVFTPHCTPVPAPHHTPVPVLSQRPKRRLLQSQSLRWRRKGWCRNSRAGSCMTYGLSWYMDYCLSSWLEYSMDICVACRPGLPTGPGPPVGVLMLALRSSAVGEGFCHVSTLGCACELIRNCADSRSTEQRKYGGDFHINAEELRLWKLQLPPIVDKISGPF